MNELLPTLDFAQVAAERQRLEALPIQCGDHPRGFERDDVHQGWSIWWGGYEYFIEDERLQSPTHLLRWVDHLGRKTWRGMTPARIARFVNAVASRKGWL